MAKTVLNPMTDEPKKLAELTQKFMLDYIKLKGTPEDKKWFVELCESNLETKVNNLTHAEIQSVKIKPVRKAFASRFFSHLLKKKGKKPTFLEEVRGLL